MNSGRSGDDETFGYYYDTQNRRVRKQYPTAGDMDGYFWDSDKQLLMETGAQTSGTAAQAMDESLWFAGRPAVMNRSASSVTSGVWARQAADWSTSACSRPGQAADCQPYGIVSDYLPKPVATIDSARRVSGVLENDPYGIVNRVSHWGEVGVDRLAHPLAVREVVHAWLVARRSTSSARAHVSGGAR